MREGKEVRQPRRIRVQIIDDLEEVKWSSKQRIMSSVIKEYFPALEDKFLDLRWKQKDQNYIPY